ncbi:MULTISPECIES: SpaA isopeptide-forming pilin-related protein [Bacillus]|uniref:SpaA isopeptide-forming pilin-related protein n=1 Tax=Bacillus glycinifermentans TaxID=1664069 RepID=A0A0T6BHY8_9BACI|nr:MULTISPECIES: SpaA isopeptide-forming pilin-related protein [Bacillus]KRT87041.1 hypothetical protein AB447_208725 [Bacillus glycinifermentans]MEC0487091.1 SpaA isopeptide-forming pilin-related protein [Bacillus glycinifermentans]UBF35243.1 Cys-Gln thioester bond-forming surface protein [Bacillus sp. PM8313]
MKKAFVYLTALLITLCSLFSLQSHVAFADSFSGDPNTKVKGWAYDSSTGGFLPTEQIKSTSDPSRFAYCLQPGKHSPHNVDMPSGGQMSNKVYRILSYGYPNISPSKLGVSSRAKAHYATQMAVWIAVGEVKQKNITYSDNSVKKAVSYLLNLAETKKDTQDVSFSVTPENAKATVKGKFLVTDPYTVKSSATGTYTVTLENAPSKAKVTDVNGVSKKTFNAKEQFRVQLPKDTPTSKIEVNVKADLKKMVSMKYNSDGTYQNIVSLKEVQKSVKVGVSASWETSGGIKIVKSSEDGTPLSGVTFDIKDSNGKIVETVKTDRNGVATTGKLPLGKYTVVETKTATGYVLESASKSVTVNADETSKLSFVNKHIRGNIRILKTDENKKALEGVTFTLFNKDGKKVVSKVTDKNGQATFTNLIYGEYYVQETKSNEGYVLDSTKHPLSIKDNGKTITLPISNKVIKGHVELIKKDGSNEDVALEGAVFELKDKDGKTIGEYTTDKDGRISVTNLKYGSYSFVEKEAPKGYVLNKEPIKFSISKNNETVKVTATNKKITGSLEITKTDVADENTRLKGAEFTITDENGKEVAKGKTDDDGVARFNSLPFGKYTYKETLAPNGYEINQETFSFEIKEDGQIIKHTVKDKKKENDTVPPTVKKHDTPHVEKKTVHSLPNTSMFQTYRMLLISSIILIIGAGILLFNLKRKQKRTN